MTMILAFVAGHRMFAISDMMISGSADDPMVGQVRSPLTNVPYKDTRVPVVGTVQKSVLFGAKHALLWAGSKVVAEVVAKELEPALKADPLLRIDDFVKGLGLTEGEVAGSAFILMYSGERLQTTYINCQSRQKEKYALVGAGTGIWDFVDDIQPGGFTSEPMPEGGDWPHLLSHMALAIVREDNTRGNVDYGYGSWFEILDFDHTLPGGGRFIKEPYAVQSWLYRDGRLHPRKTLFSQYRGLNLAVTRVDTPRNGPPKEAMYGYSDFLGRGGAITSARIQAWRRARLWPRYHFHVINDPATKEIATVVAFSTHHQKRFGLLPNGLVISDDFARELFEFWQMRGQGDFARRRSGMPLL